MYNILIYPICLSFLYMYISIYLTINHNIKYIINIYLYLGTTSLMRAASHGKTDVVKILLENGADINAKSNNG